jgi:4-hydroxy-tetrahydrodipicolinate synthase
MRKVMNGISVILATPFDAQRKVDFGSLRTLVEFEIKAGVHGITLLGILGEVLRLSESEKREITKAVVDQVKGRIPVVSGTGATGTELAILYSKEAEDIGVDAIMVAPPRLAKPNEDAIFNYYNDIANEVDIPIVVQDEPVTYGVHFSPELLARLSNIDGVEYAKIEDAPSPYKITKIRKLARDKMKIFGGLGGLYAFEELSRGACGIMTGFAYPEVLVKVYEDMTHGKKESARELFYRALPLIKFEAQPVLSLAIRKEILRRRGAIATAVVREPAAKLDPESENELDELMARASLTELSS